MKTKTDSLAKSTVVVVIMLCLSKVFGLLREILLAYRFGTSYIVDIYTICISLPSIVLAAFVSGVAQSYIPVVSRIGEERRKNFFNKCVTIMLIIAFVVCTVCFVFSDFIAGLMAPGFEGEELGLLSHSIKEIIFMIPFFTVFTLLCSHLAMKENFIFANFCDFIVTNTIIILSILLVTGENLSFLVVGYDVAIIVSTVLLIAYAIGKKEFAYRPNFAFKDKDIALIFKLAIPLGISLLTNQLNAMVDNAFASSLGEGVTSAMNYANKIQTIVLSLTTSIFMSMCYPRMNRYFAQGEDKDAMYYVKRGVAISCFVAIPTATFLFFYSDMAINFIFEYGAFSSQSTVVVSECLSYYAIGIPFYAMSAALTNALAGKQKQKRILKNTLLTVAFNVALNFALIQVLGHKGLALATSLSGVFSFVLTFIDLQLLKLKCIDRTVVVDVVKNVLSLLCALVVSWLIKYALQNIVAEKLVFVIVLAVSVLIYLTVSLLLKTDVLRWAKEKLFEMVKRKKKDEETQANENS